MGAEMPGRPAQHEHKTASHRAFEHALPDAWVSRELPEDYGVDYEVEIFRNHRATGEIFGTQVKATGTVRGSPSVRLKWRTRSYWRQLPYPVLVVLWEASTGRLWWQWSHRFDPWGLDTSKEEFTFTFPETNVWEAGHTAILIGHEVTAWRALDRGDVRLPLELVVSEDSAGVPGHSRAALVAALRELVATVHDVLKVAHVPEGPVYMTLLIDHGVSVVSMTGAGSATLHHEGADRTRSEDFPASWSGDVLLAIASRMAGWPGLLPAAARVAGAAVQYASSIVTPEIAATVMDLLVQGHRIDDAVALLGRLVATDETELPAVASLIPLLESGDGLDFTARERFASALQQWAYAVSGDGEHPRAARLAYLAARILKERDWQRTIELLHEAAQFDPGYRLRDYWHREMGGAKFLVGDFTGAAAHYRQAVDLGAADAEPLLADALFYAGQLVEARERFATVAMDAALTKDEWRIKHFVLEFLASEVGLTDTHAVREEELPPQLAEEDLRRAVSRNPLSAAALYELGRLAGLSRRPRTGWYCAAAVCHLNHPVPWIAALAAAHEELPQLADDIARCAKRFAEHAIVALAASADDSGQVVDELVSLFDSLAPEPRTPMLIRSTRAGSGDYTAVFLGDDERGGDGGGES